MCLEVTHLTRIYRIYYDNGYAIHTNHSTDTRFQYRSDYKDARIHILEKELVSARNIQESHQSPSLAETTKSQRIVSLIDSKIV
jgi:hypothetical protein